MSEGVKFNYELTREGAAKLAMLHGITKAQQRQLTAWLADTVRDTMRSGLSMQKSHREREGDKSSQMGRNVAMDVQYVGDVMVGVVGTGVKGKMSIKYASIQDKGGVIHAKGKYLTIPFPGVKGTAGDYKGNGSFFATTKAGNLILGQTLGKGNWRPLFLLKKSVTIPASGWFTNVIDARKALLEQMMSADAVLEVAAKMGAK